MLTASSKFQAILSFWKARANGAQIHHHHPQQQHQQQIRRHRLNHLRLHHQPLVTAAAAAAHGNIIGSGQDGCRAGQDQMKNFEQVAAGKNLDNYELSGIEEDAKFRARMEAIRRFCECAERQKINKQIARAGGCNEHVEPAKEPKSMACMDADHRACQFAIIQEIATQIPLPEGDDGLEEENHTVDECADKDCRECRKDDGELPRNDKGECESSGGESNEIRGLTVAENMAEAGPQGVNAAVVAEGQPDAEEAVRTKAEEELDRLFEARAAECICLACGGDKVAPPAGYDSWKEWSDDEMPECICLVCCPKVVPVPAGYRSWAEWSAYETDCWCIFCGPWKPPRKPLLTPEEGAEVAKEILDARRPHLEARRKERRKFAKEFIANYKAHCAEYRHLRVKNFFRRIFGLEPKVHWQPCLCHRIEYSWNRWKLRQKEKRRKEEEERRRVKQLQKEEQGREKRFQEDERKREKNRQKRVKRFQKEERRMEKQRLRG